MPRVRPAGPADIPELARLAEALGYPSSGKQVHARLARIATDPDHAVFIAERTAGQIVGWVHVFRNKLLESDPRAEIGGLVTDPAARRQGIGRALMQRAEDWSRGQGLDVLSLRTNIKRPDAPRFYESLGYTQAKTQYNYRKQL